MEPQSCQDGKFSSARHCLAVFLCAIAANCFLARPTRAADQANGVANEQSTEPEEKECKRSLGVGLAFMGPLVRKGFKNDFSAELHYLFGLAGSSDDDAIAHVFGLRGYRHFRTDQRLQLYAGIEEAYILAETRILNASGYAFGGFAGIEYYLSSRFSVGVDAGPYYVWIKEKDIGASGGGVDFVLSTFINFYIF